MESPLFLPVSSQVGNCSFTIIIAIMNYYCLYTIYYYWCEVLINKINIVIVPFSVCQDVFSPSTQRKSLKVRRPTHSCEAKSPYSGTIQELSGHAWCDVWTWTKDTKSYGMWWRATLTAWRFISSFFYKLCVNLREKKTCLTAVWSC